MIQQDQPVVRVVDLVTPVAEQLVVLQIKHHQRDQPDMVQRVGQMVVVQINLVLVAEPQQLDLQVEQVELVLLPPLVAQVLFTQAEAVLAGTVVIQRAVLVEAVLVVLEVAHLEPLERQTEAEVEALELEPAQLVEMADLEL